MATQKDVAKLANVSFITVSRVINNMGNVKEETRVKVEAAVKELNYYPNSIAQGLNSNKLKTLVVQSAFQIHTSTEETSYYRRILVGIERYCIKKKYNILITSQRGSLEDIDFLKPYYERKADGIIIITSKPNNKQLDNIETDNIPCVIIGERQESIAINYIDTENLKGMTDATNYLISKGHKKIGYICGNAESQNATDRLQGFNMAMKENYLNIDPNWLFEGNFTKESGGLALRYFITLDDRPTAIIASTDLMALGFYEESIKLKVNIPLDISLIGFDGNEICSYTNPPIATMYQPLELMGSKAAKILIDKIENNTKESKHLLIPVKLLPGGSILDLNT
ncbi:MAG: LacI family transcriptional regulator [Spirochaetaceae bacterium]